MNIFMILIFPIIMSSYAIGTYQGLPMVPSSLDVEFEVDDEPSITEDENTLFVPKENPNFVTTILCRPTGINAADADLTKSLSETYARVTEGWDDFCSIDGLEPDRDACEFWAECTVVSINQQRITVNINYSTYTGGARPLKWNDVRSYDPKTGRQLPKIEEK